MGATNPANAAAGTIRKAHAESIEANSVHGSDSAENAKKEIDMCFKAGRNRRLSSKDRNEAAMWVVAYIASIVLVNWLFVAVAPWQTSFGDLYVANVVVGFVFVLRDYGQRQIGQKILLATLLAGIITYFMVGPGTGDRQPYGLLHFRNGRLGDLHFHEAPACRSAFWYRARSRCRSTRSPSSILPAI